MKSELVINPDRVGMKAIKLVGGKGASFDEMICIFSSLRISVSHRFTITTKVYRKFLPANYLEAFIRQEIENINHRNVESLRRDGLKLVRLCKTRNIPAGSRVKLLNPGIVSSRILRNPSWKNGLTVFL